MPIHFAINPLRADVVHASHRQNH